MDRDTIIRLAREVGLWEMLEGYSSEYGSLDAEEDCLPALQHFAALVAAQERERYEARRLQQEAWNIDTQYASVLALMLECMILDPRRWHDDAVKVLDQYRAEWDKLNPSPSPFGKD